MAVVIVNQCQSDPGAISMFPTVKPVGGHVIAHASTTRIQLKKGRVRTGAFEITVYTYVCTPLRVQGGWNFASNEYARVGPLFVGESSGMFR